MPYRKETGYTPLTPELLLDKEGRGDTFLSNAGLCCTADE